MVIVWLPLAANAMRPSYAGGLTLVSTFEAGIYTEPLGVLLLVLTLIALDRVKSWSSAVFASALLAGVLLSNVFAAIAAVPMLLSYSVRDLSWSSVRRVGVIAGSALALSAFWWVPLARAYWTVVTMPLNPPFNHVINPAQALWLTIGMVCNGICLTRGPRNQRWFHYGLFLLCITAFLSYVPGLEALPFQLPRFVEIIIFLIAVPIAITVDRALLASGSWWSKGKAFWELTAWQRSCSMVLAGILIGALVRPMPLVNQLYTPVEIADLQPVLDFARTHTNGKYLVQTPHDTKERYSARALSSYLGAQGNESALTVYREDSTGALFYVPLSDIVSGFTSTFGISSSLIGDKELLNEPGERLLRQLNYMGVRFIVKQTSDKFNSQAVYGSDPIVAGRWNIYELPLPLPPLVERLKFLPTLVLGDISYKQRRSGQIEMNRLLEEQFRAADFDLTLVHSRTGAEALSHADDFGAMILTDYPRLNREAFVQRVTRFASMRPVILFPADSRVFADLESAAVNEPNIHVLNTSSLEKGRFLGNYSNDTTNLHLIESLWHDIAARLRATRKPVPPHCLENEGGSCPTLIHYSYDDWWQNTNNEIVFLGGPAAILTFGGSRDLLTHRKQAVETAADWLSAVSAVSLLGLALSKSNYKAA